MEPRALPTQDKHCCMSAPHSVIVMSTWLLIFGCAVLSVLMFLTVVKNLPDKTVDLNPDSVSRTPLFFFLPSTIFILEPAISITVSMPSF